LVRFGLKKTWFNSDIIVIYSHIYLYFYPFSVMFIYPVIFIVTPKQINEYKLVTTYVIVT